MNSLVIQIAKTFTHLFTKCSFYCHSEATKPSEQQFEHKEKSSSVQTTLIHTFIYTFAKTNNLHQ